VLKLSPASGTGRPRPTPPGRTRSARSAHRVVTRIHRSVHQRLHLLPATLYTAIRTFPALGSAYFTVVRPATVGVVGRQAVAGRPGEDRRVALHARVSQPRIRAISSPLVLGDAPSVMSRTASRSTPSGRCRCCTGRPSSPPPWPSRQHALGLRPRRQVVGVGLDAGILDHPEGLAVRQRTADARDVVGGRDRILVAEASPGSRTRTGRP